MAEHLVVRRHLALALEDADGDCVLVVVGGRIGLRLLGRDGRVAVDHPGENAAQSLDAERQRRQSRSSTSLTSPCSTPAWIAAPMATTSSGLTPTCGPLPKKSFK